MPYRRLPNTDQARIRSLKAVAAKADSYNVYDLAVSLKTLREICNFLPKFEVQSVMPVNRRLLPNISNTLRWPASMCHTSFKCSIWQ